MNSFFKSKQYVSMKAEYEKEYFKLHGDYAWYDETKIVKKSTASIAEFLLVTIEIEKENEEGETTVRKISKTFYQVWSEYAAQVRHSEACQIYATAHRRWSK